jgi:hypothetical protein
MIVDQGKSQERRWDFFLIGLTTNGDELIDQRTGQR